MTSQTHVILSMSSSVHTISVSALPPNAAPTVPYLSGSSLVNQNLVASSIPLSLFLSHSLFLDLKVLIIYQIFLPHFTIITIALSLSYFAVKTSIMPPTSASPLSFLCSPKVSSFICLYLCVFLCLLMSLLDHKFLDFRSHA